MWLWVYTLGVSAITIGLVNLVKGALSTLLEPDMIMVYIISIVLGGIGVLYGLEEHKNNPKQ